VFVAVVVLLFST